MKAICITHDDLSPEIKGHDNMPKPQIGEEVTIIGERVFHAGLDCYLLAKYTSPDPTEIWGYDKKNFAVYGKMDETTLVSEEFEEKYCETVK